MDASVKVPARRPGSVEAPGRRFSRIASEVVAAGIGFAAAYGLIAPHAYRGLPESTVIAAKAQDVCSLVVAVLLVLLSRFADRRVELVRLGLFAYVAYSYLIYLTGVPMNRVFLVYVVIACFSGAALIGGVVRVLADRWVRASRRLERGTGWFLVVVAVMFGALWLSMLLPYALGGAEPETQGPGGVPYPVFVLDLTVVLPCLALIGGLLLRGWAVGGPLAVVAVVKIITLFTALWAGVVVAAIEDAEVHLGPDAAPSLVMLLACGWLLVRWWRAAAQSE
jgi:hypothetical protein